MSSNGIFLCYTAVRVSSSFADAAVARIVQGTKVLALGGPDMLFQQAFGIFPEEKLIKSFACYLSTSSGPVIGTLYVSTKRLAFCSDYPLSHYPFSPQQNQRVHYKVHNFFPCKVYTLYSLKVDCVTQLVASNLLT